MRCFYSVLVRLGITTHWLDTLYCPINAGQEGAERGIGHLLGLTLMEEEELNCSCA